MKFRILFTSPEFVAVDKPYGIHVHPPEDESIRISRRYNGLAILRDQLGRYVYPVHRLDVPTSGVLLYALSPDAASQLANLFLKREIEKNYVAMVRGVLPPFGVVDSPLSEPGKAAVDAYTEFLKISDIELPWSNSRFQSSRYSLGWIKPETGRFHQIRKHLRRLNHPIVGDTLHGDGVHNRHWRKEVGRSYLFLKCYSLRFINPFDNKELTIRSRWNSEWLRVFDRFGVCPWGGGREV